MNSWPFLPPYSHIPAGKYRPLISLVLTMVAVAALALSGLPLLVPIPTQAAYPSVTTLAASNIGQTTATLNGDLTDTGGLDCGVFFEYGKTPSYEEATNPVNMSSTGNFSDSISGLSPGTTYYFRACAVNGDVEYPIHGEYQQFTTDAETYTLTVSSTFGGVVTEPGEGTFGPYNDGDIVQLRADPDSFWLFDGWTGDVSTVDDVIASETFITMHGNYSITANFGYYVHFLTISSTGGGSVTDPGEGGFVVYCDEGAEIRLLAEPNDGYAFTGWTGDVSTVGDVSAADTTIALYTDYSITANFAPLRTLTIDVVGSGTTTPPAGSHQYVQGTLVDITAFPADGWQFDGWSGEVADVAYPGAASTTISMNASYYIIANFSEIADPIYTLTIEAEGGGSTTPPWGEHEILQGDTVSISAHANDGWTFVNWTGSGVDAEAVADPNAQSTTITMSGDYSVTANFARARTLTIEIAGSGSTTPPAGSHEYAEGTVVEITATPESGWEFDGWTGEVGGIDDTTDASTTITMNASYSVIAEFVDPSEDNEPPVAADHEATTFEDTPVGITLTGSDPDGDDLTFSVVDLPSHGTLSGSIPNVTYSPNTGYNGVDSFTFKANDGASDSNIATVTVTVIPADEPVDGGGDTDGTEEDADADQGDDTGTNGEVADTDDEDTITQDDEEAGGGQGDDDQGADGGEDEEAGAGAGESGSGGLGIPVWVWVIIAVAVPALTVGIALILRRREATFQ